MKRIGIILIAILIIFLGFLSGCEEQNNGTSELIDTDGDGYNDDEDAFPNNNSEWIDSDEDGVGDNSDEYPNNPYEQYDSDRDGVGNNLDDFPYDSTQWKDSDGDGYGDNQTGNEPDIFPNNPNEWNDSDGDGLGDNRDIYDEGNGGILVNIVNYTGDGYPDEEGDIADPYFVVTIQIWDKSSKEYVTIEQQKTSVYMNKNEIYNPLPITVDIDDDTTKMCVCISAWDYDASSVADRIDINGSDSSYELCNYFNPQTSKLFSYTNDGKLDLLDEMDGYIEWTVEIVEV